MGAPSTFTALAGMENGPKENLTKSICFSIVGDWERNPRIIFLLCAIHMFSKSREKYVDQPVYRGHDYSGRKLKIILEVTYTVTDRHEWQIRPDSKGKLIEFEKKAPRADV